MIASVAFRNFKALRETSLRLAPFNLVIGPNGSGKTSLIEAILRLRALAKLPLAVNGESAQKAGGPEIGFTFSPPYEEIQAHLGCVSETVCDLLQVKSPRSESWIELKAKLGRMRSFVFDPPFIGLATPLKPGEGLSANGANLAAVLADRHSNDAAAFARFENDALRVFPEFSGFVFIPLPENSVELGMRLVEGGGVVRAENLSQGTRHLLAVLAVAHDPSPPTVVCLEEIDRGIHPRMLREMRDALYRLSYPASSGENRAPSQVIATTHSPYLLDLFREHPEEIVITQKHGSVARFERLSDRPDLPDLLKEGSLGDMWYSGILGGVPEEQ